MELLKTALIVILLTTISAKPMPRDADISDKDHSHEGIHSKHRSITSSKDSSESISSEDSSEERIGMSTNKPMVVPTTVAVTTFTSGDESEPTPEPNTPKPTAMETTPLPVTTHFTREIPTPAPVTEIRGDVK